MNIDNELTKANIIDKPFNEMIDAHIAYFQEQDADKQELLRAFYEFKEKKFNKLVKKLYEN